MAINITSVTFSLNRCTYNNTLKYTAALYQREIKPLKHEALVPTVPTIFSQFCALISFQK